MKYALCIPENKEKKKLYNQAITEMDEIIADLLQNRNSVDFKVRYEEWRETYKELGSTDITTDKSVAREVMHKTAEFVHNLNDAMTFLDGKVMNVSEFREKERLFILTKALMLEASKRATYLFSHQTAPYPAINWIEVERFR